MTPISLFLVALGVRLLSWHSVFQPSGVYPNGNDAYYHLRRIRYTIEHFPDVLSFDPLINFPAGAQPIWPPTFDWLIAASLRILPGIEEAHQLERFAVWIPPLIGAVTVVFVYFLAVHFFSRSAAWVAAGSLALLPGHVFYSRLGEIDHHFLVASMVTATLAITMQLFRTPEAPGADGKGLAWSGALGLSMALCVVIWPGTLLHLGLLQIAMLARLLGCAERASALVWSKRLALAQIVACAVIYPMAAGHEWVLWGPLSPVVLSDFQPLYFFLAALCFGGLGVVWCTGWWGSSTRVGRALSAGLLGGLVLLVSLVAIPGLGLALNDALSWFGKDEEFQAVVNESVPLFAGRAGFARANAFLSLFIYLVPVLCGWLAWRSRHEADRLLLIGWTLGLFLATLVQWRFMNSYSIGQSLVLGLAWSSGRDALRPLLMTRARRVVAAIIAFIIVVLAFQPAMRSYTPHFRNWARAMRGSPTIPVGTLLHTRFVADAARFLRDRSPAGEGAKSSVLGPWGDGHIVKYVAGHAVVQDNFGDDVAPRNFERAEEYFSARDESRALDIAAPMATRYVLVRSTGSGHGHGYAPDSLFTRLYELKGSRARPAASAGTYKSPIDALQRHRLIYQSEPMRVGDRHPYCMVFEIVAGAELVGRTLPGDRVTVRLEIRTKRGDVFDYVSQTRADEAGWYAMRLPYATGEEGPEVRTADHYRVSTSEGGAVVRVTESAVLGGERVEARVLGEDEHT